MSTPYFSQRRMHQVAGHPHLVGGLLGALAEDLEFPLALGHFGVDAFVVDAGVEAEVEMLLDDLAGDVADVLVADAGVVRALRRGIAARRGSRAGGRPGRRSIPARSRTMRRGRREWWRACWWVRGLAVGHHDFAHHQHAVVAGAVRDRRRPASARSRSCGLRPAGSSCRRSPTAEAASSVGNTRRIP